MTDVLKLRWFTDAVLPIEVEVLVSRSVPAAPKAKARRVSKKRLFTELEVEVTSSLKRVQADGVLPLELLSR